MNIDIVYKNKNLNLLIINKPEGIPVHGGNKVSFSILDILFKKYKKKFFLIHRIDQNTSGILLLTDKATQVPYLTKCLKKSKKIYLTIVLGKFSSQKFKIVNEISTHKKNSTKLQQSETFFKVIQSFAKYSLLSAELITGRTHQIRKHLKSIGHPILGDDKYGDFELNRKLNNKWEKSYNKKFSLCLQAHQIYLTLPHKRINIKCSLSNIFQHFFQEYNLNPKI